MPLAPGNATILVVEKVADTSTLDRKGAPALTPVVTPVKNCKVSQGRGIERQDGSTDYAKQPWSIATPPDPAAIAIQPAALIWYDDSGRYAGSTVRDTYQDPELGPRDVAVLQVVAAQVLTDIGDAVDHVTITAKSEVG